MDEFMAKVGDKDMKLIVGHSYFITLDYNATIDGERISKHHEYKGELVRIIDRAEALEFEEVLEYYGSIFKYPKLVIRVNPVRLVFKVDDSYVILPHKETLLPSANIIEL